MSDLVANPEDRFSHNEAHMSIANMWLFLYGDVPAMHKYVCEELQMGTKIGYRHISR